MKFKDIVVYELLCVIPSFIKKIEIMLNDYDDNLVNRLNFLDRIIFNESPIDLKELNIYITHYYYDEEEEEDIEYVNKINVVQSDKAQKITIMDKNTIIEKHREWMWTLC